MVKYGIYNLIIIKRVSNKNQKSINVYSFNNDGTLKETHLIEDHIFTGNIHFIIIN